MSRNPTINIPPQGRTVAVVGDVYRFLATGEDTNGKYALWEALVPPGGGPPPHVHSREEEGFYILEGEITFTVNGERVVAPFARQHASDSAGRRVAEQARAKAGGESARRGRKSRNKHSFFVPPVPSLSDARHLEKLGPPGVAPKKLPEPWEKTPCPTPTTPTCAATAGHPCA